VPSNPIPAHSPLFIGRGAQLAQIERALARVAVAWIHGVGGVGKSTLAYAFASRWPHPTAYGKAGGGVGLAALLDDAHRQLGPSAASEPSSDAELRAAAQGKAGLAHALLEQDAALARSPGYALERAIATVVSGIAAARAGRDAEAREAYAAAEQQAAAEHVDADLLAALRAAVGVGAEAAPALVVLDARTHELRGAGGVVSFKTRPVLRRLLYALAEQPDRTVAKETLVRRMWDCDYHPLRHDSPLWSNVHRLRRLVRDAGLCIEVDEAGYRLSSPPGFLLEW
jgi:hypothetical protein